MPTDPITGTDTSETVSPPPDFAGREWLLARVDQWLAQPDAPSYFLLTGEPGIGKTTFAARLMQVRPVAAVHFCMARRALSLDPLDFARSISHQLTRLSGFAESLVQEKNMSLAVEQHADKNEGQMIGVLIRRLVVEAPSPVEAFNRAVLSPLKRLGEKGIDQTILIVVDGLDEALEHVGLGHGTIVDLLANAGDWPTKVRILLTSNPESRVLRHFEAGRAKIEQLAADQDDNRNDLRAYASQQIQSLPPLLARLADQQINGQAYASRVADACQGNFLYLTWLLPDLASGRRPLEALDALPAGLDGIYREFLRTRHIGQDSGDWTKRDRPVLSVLAAAQEPLPATILAQLTGLESQILDDALRDLDQCLEPSLSTARRYQLYHQSLAEFLRDRQRAEEFWIDLPPVHRRIAQRYLSDQGLDWQAVDEYALRHLPSHLYLGNQTDVLNLLLLDYRWLRARLGAAGISHMVDDYDLAETNPATQPVQQALRLAAHILAGDPTQLSGQLVGRLPAAPAPILELRQAAARQAGTPWLQPLTASLVVAGGPLVRTLAGHEDAVHAIIPLQGGQRLASASYDGSVVIWDLNTGAALFELGKKAPLGFEGKGWPSLAPLAQGRFVCSTPEGALVVYDAETGAEVRRFGEHPRGIRSLAALPDGRGVVTGSSDGSIVLWDAENGARLRYFGAGHTNTVHGFGVSPAGDRVVSGSEDKRLLIWDVVTGQRSAELLFGHAEAILDVITVPGRNQIVSASRDGTMMVWDMDQQRSLHTMVVSSDTAIPAVAALPDGRRLVSATWNGRLDVWDLETGQHVRTIAEETGRCEDLAALPDGRRIVSAHRNGAIKVWDADEPTQTSGETSDQPAARAGHARPVIFVKALPGNRRAVSLADDGTMRLWDIQTGKELLVFELGQINGFSAVSALQVVSEQMVVTGRRDGWIQLIELAAGQAPQSWKAHEMSGGRRGFAGRRDGLLIWAVAALPGGQGFISASDLGQVAVWDRNGKQRRRFTVDKWGDKLYHFVRDLVPTPDGRRALAVSNSGQGRYQHRLRLWEVETGAVIWALPDPVTVVAVRSDASQVMGISDGAWCVWDVETGQEAARLPAPAFGREDACWLPGGGRAIGVTADGELRLGDVQTGAVLAGFGADARIQACAATPDGQVVVAGDSAGGLHFLRIVDAADQAPAKPTSRWQFLKRRPGEHPGA